MTHASRTYTKSLNEENGRDIVKVDFVNAFNMVDRQTMHDVVTENVPRMLNWFRSLYTDPTTMVLVNGVVISHRMRVSPRRDQQW